MRRLLAVTAALAAAAAVTTSASGYTANCSGAQLRGHLYETNGAAGTILLSITLTNKGPVACSMKGYARLQLMASARRALPTHVVHGGLAILNRKPAAVLLARGGVATILIAYSDVVHDGERSCPTGREILVRVPGDRTWIPVLATTSACAHGTLAESPLLAGKRRAS